MRKVTLMMLALVMGMTMLIGTASAGWVNGYTKRDGTYVEGHWRSDANSTVRDNWSYKGNTNPYTGSKGTNYNRDNSTSEWYGTKSSRTKNWWE